MISGFSYFSAAGKGENRAKRLLGLGLGLGLGKGGAEGTRLEAKAKDRPSQG